jgi:sigma-B regulation protein RsbU (phosphoserine phosphatase)
MQIRRQFTPLKYLIRRSVRYLLVARGFVLLEVAVVIAALSYVLTGSRIAMIDSFGNRADIVASIFVTVLAIAALRTANHRVMGAIDRRFFREAYNSHLVLTELDEATRNFSNIDQLIVLVASKVSDALHPESITIFLEDETTGDFLSVFCASPTAPASLNGKAAHLVLPHDGLIIDRIKESTPITALYIQSTDASADNYFDSIIGVACPVEKEALQAADSALLIPIASNSHLYGIVSLGPRLGDLPYSKEDVELLLVVAAQMSAVIENAKLIRRIADEERINRELEMAADVQQHLFPSGVLEDSALELSGVCIQARGVGGDYYDYFKHGHGRVGMAIADVAGKGIAAALRMSTVQALLRSQMLNEDSRLTDVVSAMNCLLRRSASASSYVTFFLAQFNEETRALTYVNAGHNPPILLHKGSNSRGNEAFSGIKLSDRTAVRMEGSEVAIESRVVVEVADREKDLPITLLTTGGPIIGSILNGPYEQETIQLENGDVLVAYTDGVTESLNSQGIEFGEERLRSLITTSSYLSARQIVERVIATVKNWQGGAPQYDDITLIVAKVK